MNLNTNTLETCWPAFRVSTSNIDAYEFAAKIVQDELIAMAVGLSIFGVMAIYSATYVRKRFT